MADRVLFRPAAEKDLTALYEHIRDVRGDPKVAIGYIRRIRAFCETLAAFPSRGALRDDIRPGLRIIGFERRLVLAFVVTAETVVIGRVFYGGRNYEVLLGDDGGGQEWVHHVAAAILNSSFDRISPFPERFPERMCRVDAQHLHLS